MERRAKGISGHAAFLIKICSWTAQISIAFEKFKYLRMMNIVLVTIANPFS
jgi:hypothetical protein